MQLVVVRQLQHKIERNEAAFQFNPAHDDVYAVSSLLKVCIVYSIVFGTLRLIDIRSCISENSLNPCSGSLWKNEFIIQVI